MSNTSNNLQTSHGIQSLRMSLFALLLLLCVLLPFALWGDMFDRASPLWLQTQHGKWLIAALGIALLVADVLLPIPSSVVNMGLCWSLGPIWGGVCVAVGCMLAFVTGYGLGRLMPEARLRNWVGAPLWDNAQRRAGEHAMWWIVVARPLPVLAEMSALLAGVWRVPLLPALSHAAFASCVVGTLYAISAWLGRGQPDIAVTLLALLTLPSLAWFAHRIALRRMLSARDIREASAVSINKEEQHA